ncbi:uncharacterized protein [Bemisia tabaci]|uniref:uncharacterized protein isoform X2 n=1 Tax=Bemisia tabaci TaxID=7038 RepID=UPI003B27DE2E
MFQLLLWCTIRRNCKELKNQPQSPLHSSVPLILTLGLPGRMKGILLCLVATVLLNLASGTICSCPWKCTCTSFGTSGITAECSALLLGKQNFCDSIQHLKVINAEHEIALGAGVFQDLGLKKVESIEIVNSSLSTIDVNAFRGLENLYYLSLADNGLILIHPDTFIDNPSLKVLILSGNALQLTQVLEPSRKYLIKSSSLLELKLARCQLRSLLPDTFSQVPNLMLLDLSSNRLSRVTSDIFEPIRFLEELNLSNNMIRELSKNTFSHLEELMDLNLRNNSLTSFDNIDLNDMESLDLSMNRLEDITNTTFARVEGIESLNISSNVIRSISADAFAKMPSLRHLDMSWNQLFDPLDADLFSGNFDLETLSIAGNKIGNFSDDRGFFGKHLMLYKLDASHCGLIMITDKDFEGLDNIASLDLSHNHLTFVSIAERRSLSNLKSLKMLDLSHNRIEELTEDMFANNTKLTSLNLAGNPITVLPVAAFVPLSNLDYLDVSSCELVSIWNRNLSQYQSLELLPRLSYINISHNQLQFLHVHDFKPLENLKTVELVENPLECVGPFTQLVEYFIGKRIGPSQYAPKSLEYLSENIKVRVRKTLEWKPIVQEVCIMYENDALSPKENTLKKEDKKEIDLSKIPFIIDSANIPMSAIQAETELSEIDESDHLSSDALFHARLFMHMHVLAVIVLASMCFGLMWAVQKRRKMAVQKAFFGSMGGHIIKTKSGGGSLYYKLYEECSVPTQPAVHGSGFPFAKFQIPSLVSDYKKVKIVKTVNEV